MMAPQWRRRLIAMVGLGLAGAAAVWALRPQPVPVDIARIDRGALQVTVNEEGRTRVRDIYVVSAPLAGMLQRSPVEVGDSVRAGDTVVSVIQPTAPAFLDVRARREAEAAVQVADAAVGVARAQMREMEAQLAYAKTELARAVELSRRGVVAERTLDDARVAHSNAEARLQSAQATLEMRRRELETARARLIGPDTLELADDPGACCILVRAPVDGRVLNLFHESEQVVAAGTPLLEVGDPGNLEVVVEMLSSDAVRVAPGAFARIEGWGRPEPLTATVRRVEPAGFTKISALGIEEQRVRVILDIGTPRSARAELGHGYRVIAHVTVEQVRDATLAPISALFRHGDAWAVYVVDGDDRATRRIVEIGARTNREAVVRSGLEPGERVILYPGDRVADGVRVTERS
jgi:HlyD family secretion protein